MKKKVYEQPQVEIHEVNTAEIICMSGSSTEGLTQDDFDWDDDASGSSTELLTEDEFDW